TPNQETSTSAIKVLAEGFHSSVTHPFVAVVRDPETYTELLKLDANLPKLDSVVFRSNALVAAFLEERNTGGSGGERLQAAIRVIREGDVATFEFRLAGGEGMKKRALNEYATGTVAGDGTITLNKMSADSLINKPNSGLKATGALSRKDNKLSFTFISLPLMIADGYTGQGKIEADLETPLIKEKP